MAHELKNVLTNFLHDRKLKTFARKYLSGSLVDIGCGKKPYRKIVAPFVSSHLGIDMANSPRANAADIFASAYDLPVPDCSFESAICTSVLEHLEEPSAALIECFRVLKPGGIAIYSVPFIWHLHEEPRDFFRYSKYGLDYLFGKAGFAVLENEALCGFWGTFGQMFVYNLYRLNVRPIKWFGIIDIIGIAIQASAYVLDRIDRTERWTSLYMIVARKPPIH